MRFSLDRNGNRDDARKNDMNLILGSDWEDFFQINLQRRHVTRNKPLIFLSPVFPLSFARARPHFRFALCLIDIRRRYQFQRII